MRAPIAVSIIACIIKEMRGATREVVLDQKPKAAACV